MLQATRTLWEPGCLKQLTFETLIGLLASTALRIGEALRLTLCNLHPSLDPPHLEIRNTKFGKSRLCACPRQHCPQSGTLPNG